MFDRLQIYDRRERALVGAADLALRVAGPALRMGRRTAARPPARVLLLRLERIGDLVMTLEAIEDLHRALPAADLDLVVGSWNVELAARIRGIRRVETLDVSWLARDGSGTPFSALWDRARHWARRHYDLAVNFEPDIRSNLLLAASRASMTAGFSSGGGGSLLDVTLPYDTGIHTAVNAQRLVAAIVNVPARTTRTRLELGTEERRLAKEKLGSRRGPLVGMHVSAGRDIKQWDLQRFSELAVRLANARHASIVVTGSAADRPLSDPVILSLAGHDVVDLVGDIGLPTLGAVLEQLDVFVTGDTGPMHLAAAVGTPVVAIFGPSNPRRYAPMDPVHRIVRVDLPCSPCNRIRLPPERCLGHVPDCLTGVDVEMVYRAVEQTLDSNSRLHVRSGSLRG